MSLPPFFSIILPTYNRAHLLPRAIDSVLKQSFADWKLIIVDDGSADDSCRLLQTYTEKHPKISFIANPHQGLAKTRNTGIRTATGLYLTFLDSDDEFKPNHLELHAELLKRNPAYTVILSQLDVIGNPYVPDSRDTTKMIHVNECVHAGFFIHKKLMDEVGEFPDADFGEDRLFFEIIRSKEIKVIHSGYATYRYYRTEPDSMCNQILQKQTNL